MPSRRPKSKDSPAKLASRMKRRWRIVLIRSKGEVLGPVEAADSQAAEKVAAIQFELDEQQRRRTAGAGAGLRRGALNGATRHARRKP